MTNALKLGYAPTRRFVFSKEDAKKYKELTLQKIKRFTDAQIVDLEGINSEGLLFDNNSDIEKVIKRFKDEEVDAVFFPHCNFGTEEAVARVAKAVGKPVLLWGPRDEAPLPDGNRLRDTQCGLFASGKILRRCNVSFTYIVNSRIEDLVFERGFKNFIATANVVKAMNNLRILQISTRPASFLTMMYDEGILLEKFGISVVPITLQDIKTAMEEIVAENGIELKETVNFITTKLDCSETTPDTIVKVAALKVAIKKFVKDNGCTAAAIQCWTALQDSIGIVPCLCNALLTDEGIPVTCETDIHGAITSVMAQAAAMGKTAPFFADVTVRHPENENGELIFHCGNFPVSLVPEGCKPKFKTQFALDSHAPGTSESEIKGGDVSIVRFDGDHGEYSLFMGKAKGIKGPFTRGSFLWVEVNDWPLWEEKLVTGPYVHHCVGIHENIIPVLFEACKYIPGLNADPVDPTADQIVAWLRGRG